MSTALLLAGAPHADAPGPPFGSPSATTAYDINDRGQIVEAKLPPPEQRAAGESGLSAPATPGAGGPGPG